MGFGAAGAFEYNSSSRNGDNGYGNGNFGNQQGFGNNFWQSGADNWHNKIADNSSVENYPYLPIPTPSNVPTLKPAQPTHKRQESCEWQQNPTQAIQILSIYEYDNAYLKAINSLANGPQLPGPVF